MDSSTECGECFTTKKRWAKHLLEETTKTVQLETSSSCQKSHVARRNSSFLQGSNDLRLDGKAELLKSDKLKGWTSAKLRERYGKVEQGGR